MIFNISLFLCFVLIIVMYFYFLKKKQTQKYIIVLLFAFFAFLLCGVAIANFIESKIIQQIVVACFLLISNVVTFFVVSKVPAVDKVIAFIKIHLKFIAVIPLIVAVLLAIPFLNDFSDENFDKYEDTNGDSNYSLQSINDDMIVSLQNKSIAIQASESTKGNNSGMTSHERYDYDKVDYSCSEFHGVKIVQATKVSSDDIEFRVDNVVNKGNFQISLVVDGAIIHNFDLNKNSTYHLKSANGKEIFIVLAGECADINLEITRAMQ